MITGTKNSMTNISRVYYNELDDISTDELSSFYFYYNHRLINNEMREQYEKYEESQIKLRNTIIGKSLSDELSGKHPNMSSILFGISSIKNKAIIIAEY